MNRGPDLERGPDCIAPFCTHASDCYERGCRMTVRHAHETGRLTDRELDDILEGGSDE